MRGNAPDKSKNMFAREMMHCPCELNLKKTRAQLYDINIKISFIKMGINDCGRTSVVGLDGLALA